MPIQTHTILPQILRLRLSHRFASLELVTCFLILLCAVFEDFLVFLAYLHLPLHLLILYLLLLLHTIQSPLSLLIYWQLYFLGAILHDGVLNFGGTVVFVLGSTHQVCAKTRLKVIAKLKSDGPKLLALILVQL